MNLSGRDHLARAVATAIVLALTAVLLVLSPGAATAAPKPKVRHAEKLLRVWTSVYAFSPNGDGSKDRAYFTYRLNRPAIVRVTIRNAQGDVVRTRSGKRLPSTFWKSWPWNAVDRAGNPVPDGTYRATVTATSIGRDRAGRRLRDTDVASARALSTFQMNPPRGPFQPKISIDRDAIYRDTTYFKDEFHWAAAPYDGSPRDDLGAGGNLGQSRITGPDGTVVYDSGRSYPVLQTWDGTAKGGRVPAGAYTLANTWWDEYGNTTSTSVPLTVADGSRVEQRHTVTVTPAESRVGTATEPFPVVRGDRDATYTTYHCPPRPSDRFPAGGLSFSMWDPRCTESFDTFRVASPWPLNLNLDTYRITTTGGPTTDAGGTALIGTSVEPYVTTGPGAETDTTIQTKLAWQILPDPNHVTWTVNRKTGGYDAKSFTVDIYHYAPPS